jgi:hypothetical protein
MDVLIKPSLYTSHSDMKRFLIKILTYFFVLAGLIFLLVFLFSRPIDRKVFRNYETESNLFLIEENQNYDFLFMGISHARNFSRHKNHLITEKILGGSILNLGRGGGLISTAAEYTYLRYFCSKGNTAQTLIYVLTPPMLYSGNLENNANAFAEEPFKIRFFFQYLCSDGKNKSQQLYTYLHSKMGSHWKKLGPWSADSLTVSLSAIDTAKINSGIKVAYPRGLDRTVFERNIKVLEKTLHFAHKKGMSVYVIFTPTLFGHWPGHENIMNSLSEINKELPFIIFDYTSVIDKPGYYSDHHHLNTKGIVYLLENYLKPDLNKKNL